MTWNISQKENSLANLVLYAVSFISSVLCENNVCESNNINEITPNL